MEIRNDKHGTLARHEFAYLILSHGEVDQTIRLIETIRTGSPLSAILLHHDARSPAPDDRTLQRLEVQLVKPRISASWGDFSLVDAMLSGISFALENNNFDWLAVLSGQDYPLRPFPQFEGELRVSSFDAYVSATPVDSSPYGFRYYMRYWALPKIRHTYLLPRSIHKAIGWAQGKLNQSNTLLRIQSGPRRSPTQLGIKAFDHPFSSTFVCYKGSQWMTLSRRASSYLVDFGQNHPEVLKHYRRTFIPDESYFQTVLCNADNLRVCHDNRRFILWNDSSPGHPVTLTMQNFDAMISSSKDFGRKFDLKVDAEVLARLNDVVINKVNFE